MRELLGKPKTKPKNKKPLRERKAALVAKHAKQTDTHAHTHIHTLWHTHASTHTLIHPHTHTHIGSLFGVARRQL